MADLQVGTIVELTAKEHQGSKWILSDGATDVIMNESEAPDTLKVGENIQVFLFTDRRGELAATSALPHITVDTYGWAKVLRVSERDGAIVDIGTSKEVRVSTEDLPKLTSLWPELGDHIFMTLRVDRHGELFGRLITEEKVAEHIELAPDTLFNKNLSARPYRLLPVGSFLISVPDKYRIFVHQSEMKAEPRLGEEVNVRIIGVKEDGSLNGSLLPRKQERLSDDSEEIFRYLQEVGGKMPFTDKSSPDEIQEMFNMSKAAFKRALGKLMKEGKIVQVDTWTEVKK